MRRQVSLLLALWLAVWGAGLGGCTDAGAHKLAELPEFDAAAIEDTALALGDDAGVGADDGAGEAAGDGQEGAPEPPSDPGGATLSVAQPDAQQLFGELGIIEDYRASFVHGYKGPEHQRYIVLHDTEGTGSPQSVINWWDSNGAGVAAHFIVGTDGSVYQCVPMDSIAHHAGYGNAGHNAAFGVSDESRDDKVGTAAPRPGFSEYGMNSHSIGIELVHVGGSGSYPAAQLEALDALIAYIDAYYGFESEIIDHKTWCTPNSDTSPEFAGYLANYRAYRSHRAP